MKIAVLGAGAWGTALAQAFAPRHAVVLWTWLTDHAAAMAARRENEEFLPGYRIPEDIVITADGAVALAGAELAIIATPVAGMRGALDLLARHGPGTPFLWVCKGMESGTGLLPHQIAADVAGAGNNAAPRGALTGPSFADEVARGMPTAVTLASTDATFARDTAQALNTPRLRIYASDDPVGAEVGGAVKNVLAIAAGISDGLGLGLNARAALITRGLAEITRFGIALGAKQQTFMGLAGLGDLILTCTGDLSRNRRVGLALAVGQTPEAIQRELGHVAEGVFTAREVARRAKELGVEMPITEAVCAVLDGRLAAAEAVSRLMARDPRSE